jgi:hydroxylamine reductase
METGKFGVEAMALLDKANTSTYGAPEISSVKIGAGKNPGILVSGHDLKDLEMLLEQTKGMILIFIPTLKCFLQTTILSSRSIRISTVTTETHGGSKKKNLKALTALFL